MTELMENTLLGLIASLILLSIVGVVRAIQIIATTREERRSTERRLGIVESELRELREVYAELREIDNNIQHLLQTQTTAMRTLNDLSAWQNKHETIIEEAAIFIREIRTNGMWPKGKS